MNSQLSNLKPLCLLVLLACHRLALREPSGSTNATQEERDGYAQVGDSIPGFVKGSARVSYMVFLQMVTLSELYVVLSRMFPIPALQPLLSALVPNQTAVPDIHITPLFLVGLGLIIGSTALRLLCYRTLGSNFTFDLTIRKEHTLCTEGPYAIVRHPSYAAITLYAIGQGLCHFGSGSWWVECGIKDTTVGKAVGWIFFAFHFIAIPTVWRRCKLEDEVLQQEFGERWIRWAKKTPYAICPRIF